MQNKKSKIFIYFTIAAILIIVLFIIFNWDGFVEGFRAGSDIAE